jgi:hypothetical protein
VICSLSSRARAARPRSGAKSPPPVVAHAVQGRLYSARAPRIEHRSEVAPRNREGPILRARAQRERGPDMDLLPGLARRRRDVMQSLGVAYADGPAGECERQYCPRV